MDAVRRRLAPIRGIPTKAGGMTDPNSDIKEVFDLIEGLPTAPVKMFDNLRRWVRLGLPPARARGRAALIERRKLTPVLLSLLVQTQAKGEFDDEWNK
jgi:hypothetical protein